jgi:septum formation protein
MRLLLASASPRRADLLRAAGFEVEVVSGRVDERRRSGETPEAYVVRLARAKALTAVTAATGGGGTLPPVIAADTIVLVEGEVLGKPADAAEAAAMLRRLGGRTHDVLTGVAVSVGGRALGHVERTRVRMAGLTPAEVAWYVASGEPFDKAGAYAIQGLASRFVESVDGSYSNVVGLPVAAVYRLLGELGALDPEP